MRSVPLSSRANQESGETLPVALSFTAECAQPDLRSERESANGCGATTRDPHHLCSPVCSPVPRRRWVPRGSPRSRHELARGTEEASETSHVSL